MSHNVIDHQIVGVGRIATQYQESEDFKSYLLSLLAYCNEIENTLDLIEQQSDIDVAIGVNLDTIGDIVGISRVIPNSLGITYFGFDDSVPAAAVFGEKGNPSIGARFREKGESGFASTSLADPEYRQLIRAKIIKNHSHGRIEDVIQGLKFLFNVDTVAVHDNYNMTFNVAIGRELTLVEQALLALDILPRPAGVKINEFLYFVEGAYFGFSDQHGALGFREFGSSTGGGIFAEAF